MPASVKEAMKYGPPLSPKLREQMVSATHNAGAEDVHSCAGVSLHIAITILPCPSEVVRDRAAASSHSLSHAAVRGALAGASRNSSANRVRSSATSIS